MLSLVVTFWAGGAACTAMQLYGFTKDSGFSSTRDVLETMVAILFWPAWNALVFWSGDE